MMFLRALFCQVGGKGICSLVFDLDLEGDFTLAKEESDRPFCGVADFCGLVSSAEGCWFEFFVFPMNGEWKEGEEVVGVETAYSNDVELLKIEIGWPDGMILDELLSMDAWIEGGMMFWVVKN